MKKFLKQQNFSIDKPWIDFYDEGVPKTLNYPDLMLWEFIKDAALKYPTNLACEYYGTSVTCRTFMYDIEEAARG